MYDGVVKKSQRSIEQLRQHYEVEKELANRLRQATKEERKKLYAAVYNELYLRVSNHPQLTTKLDVTAQSQLVARRMRVLKHFLKPNSTFLEVGPGDCSLSYEVANYARQVYAVDVSEEITRTAAAPANFKLILSDGSSIPVSPGSIDLAYSNQLMEHLHPEDALEQLRNISAALAPGGIYVCITPNRLTGPHDISKYFDTEATGFHLKEYTVTELIAIMRQAGFTKFRVYICENKGKFMVLPALVAVALEAVLSKLPHKTRRQLGRRLKLNRIIDKIVAIK